MNKLIYKIGIAAGIIDAVFILIYLFSAYFLYKPVLLNLVDYLPFSMISRTFTFVVLVRFLLNKSYKLLIPFLSVLYLINFLSVGYLWLGLNKYVQYNLTLGNNIDYVNNGFTILFALFIIFSKSRKHELFRLYGLFLFLISLTYSIILLGGWDHLQPISGLEFILPLLLSFIYYKEIQQRDDIEAEILDDSV